MKNIKKLTVLFIISLLISIIAACSTESNEVEKETELSNETEEQNTDLDNGQEVNKNTEIRQLNTKNVTRLNSDDPFEVAVLTSQTIWPATHEANRPGTIMLAPLESWQVSLASLSFVHHPNDGPLLFTNNGEIPEQIENEINRLQPKGNDQGVQILVVGELKEQEMAKLEQYQVETINADNASAFAYLIDEEYSNLINEVPSSVIIGSLDDKAKEYTIVAGSWITHMNESLLYVSENAIPTETVKALEKRDGKAAIYVVGPETVISEKVVENLRQYGSVTRIAGDTPAETSIEFAKFKDQNTNFGWGITKPGHGIVMVSSELPELAITSAPFAHLGKHAPMVWLENGEFTEGMHEYLAMLKPTFEIEPTEGPYNHVYLIGNEQLVNFQTQGYIDEILEIVPANGGGHGDHGSHNDH